jgi:hypothetical protein
MPRSSSPQVDVYRTDGPSRHTSEALMLPQPVELQLVGPALAFGRFGDELRELRRMNAGSGRSNRAAWRGSRFFGTTARLATASPAGRSDFRFCGRGRRDGGFAMGPVHHAKVKAGLFRAALVAIANHAASRAPWPRGAAVACEVYNGEFPPEA